MLLPPDIKVFSTITPNQKLTIVIRTCSVFAYLIRRSYT